MKKLLLILLFLPFIGFGQNYPGTEVQLLLGKTLVVKSYKIDFIASTDGDTVYYEYYSEFYKNNKLTKTYKRDFYDFSKLEYLVDKKFKVVNIQPYSEDKKYYILELENNEETIYFKYDSNFSSNFPFKVVGGIILSDEYYCKNIIEDEDKFSGVKSYTKRVRNVKILKTSKDGMYLTALSMHQISYQVKSKNGVILLLENGEKIEKPNAYVEVDVHNPGGGHPYIHRTSIKLTDAEVSLLSKNKITDYRIGYVDGAISSTDALTLMKTIRCFISLQ